MRRCTYSLPGALSAFSVVRECQDKAQNFDASTTKYFKIHEQRDNAQAIGALAAVPSTWSISG